MPISNPGNSTQDWVLLETLTPGNATGTATFTSFTGGVYKAFKIIGRLQGGDYLNLRINGDTGANYDFNAMLAVAGSISDANTATGTSIQLCGTTSSPYDACFEATISKNLNTNRAAVVSKWGRYGGAGLVGGEWNNTADNITSFTLLMASGNFAGTPSFTLYGLKG